MIDATAFGRGEGRPRQRGRLAETIEWLIGVFAARSPGGSDELLLLDSTPVECGRSLETARCSKLADLCGYGYSRSHSRWFWGMRLHLACAPDGTPRAAALVTADRPEREIALTLLPRALTDGETSHRSGAVTSRSRAAVRIPTQGLRNVGSAPARANSQRARFRPASATRESRWGDNRGFDPRHSRQ